MTALLQRFEDITKKDILTAGGKGANLGEMVHAGIPVPEGAVLTTEAYRLYVKENKIDLKAPAEEIRKAFEFMKARDKQNIEKELRLSDEQKEKEKQQVDAWYDYCEQMLKAELEKRCEIRNY